MPKPSKRNEKIYMYGRHALSEALSHSPQAIKKVFLADTVDRELRSKAEKLGISIASIKEETMQLSADTPHQGVIAVMDTERIMIPFDTFIQSTTLTKDTAIVLLDELQDPHNVGAIIRSAAAFGATAVLIPEHNQAQITGAVIKASAGLVFRIQLVKIGNINQTIRTLKDKGCWIYGLAMEGSKPLATETFDAPTVFIVGNEGEGIRQKTLELCDVTLSIPMHARAESLNAAVSAAVVLYAWSNQHTEALKG